MNDHPPHSAPLARAADPPPARELVLGVDGGGTKTVAWLAALEPGSDDTPLGIGYGGPGNPRAAGFDTALNNIGAAVDAAFLAAGQRRAAVSRACLALAGADRADERARVEAWAAQHAVAAIVRVTNDAEPLLATVSPDGCAIALISGTGSFAVGRNATGETARCGGWGYLLGDEGGGYAIALSGLRCAVRAADGRDPPTELLDRFLRRLRIAASSDLVSALYGPAMSRQQIADLAGVVFEASQAGDPAAGRIVAKAARELAALVRTLRRRLTLAPGAYPLALAGGIILNSGELRRQLEEQLAETNDSPAFVQCIPDPVRGAVVLARQLAR